MIVTAGGQPFADWLFAKGKAAGFNTFRFFAIGDNNGARSDRLNALEERCEMSIQQLRPFSALA